MDKSYWEKKEVAELWSTWSRQPADRSLCSFARDYAAVVGRSENAVRLKLADLTRNKGWKIPQSNHAPLDNNLVMEGDAFVLMDAHIPYHHAEFINRCLEVCEAWGIRQAILGGDALDLNAFSRFPDDFNDSEKRVIDSRLQEDLLAFSEKLPAKQRAELQDKLVNAETQSGNISEEIRESRIVLRAFQERFERIDWVMGNHEQRVLRILQKALDAADLTTLFGADSPKWRVSPYYWSKLTSGGEDWQIEHPINSGKGSSKRLAPKFNCHIIMGHGHHFAMMTDPSGRWLAIEPGMGGDEERMAYVQQRHNAADRHMVGAVIVRQGKATLLNRFSDWGALLEMKKTP